MIKETVVAVLGPAMEITSQKEAEQYLKDYASFIVAEASISEEEATKRAKSNLGYWAGYYSDSVRKRVEKYFSCTHPIFGSVKSRK